MADPTPADPERVARAWELSVRDGLGVRAIGEALGVSKTTAAEWVQRGRLAEQASWMLDRAEQQARSAARLEMYDAWLIDEYRKGVASARELVPILLKVDERRSRLLGLDAPTRVAVTQDAPTPDPELVEAIRAAQRRAADDERALTQGQDGGDRG